MRLLSIVTICCLAFAFCNKKQDEPFKRTFIGNLPIAQTNTPPTAVAGQDIRTNVRCQLPSINGSIFFQGFNIQETTPRNFAISAKALYKDWTQIGLDVIWNLDTVATVSTTTPGMYVLQFYNEKKLLKSDTVQVN
jgi:hypothetical protein